MLRTAVRLLAYVSILTSARTSSSYLEPAQSLIGFRRGALNDDMQQVQPPARSDDEWRAFYMPRVLNANGDLLYAAPPSPSNSNKSLLSSKSSSLTSNTRRANKRPRKSKRPALADAALGSRSASKQLYESHSKRRNGDALDPPKNASANFTSGGGGGVNSNSNSNNNNDYPTTHVDVQQERELQQLFGLEGARKYQEYQLQQHLLGKMRDDPSSGGGGGDAAGVGGDEEEVDELAVKEPQKKRDGGAAEEMQDVSDAMINQMMSRTTRRQREYDVPLIQCPPATDGMERFACPTPDRQGRYRCIDDHVLCDGFIDCPEGADEDRQACMFYKTTKAHLDVLADALLRWARGR